MDWSEMFFQGWSGLVRTLVVGTLAYAFLVVSLRVSGKRTLAKLNAFDLVITVAFGSCLASILLSENVPLAEGALALVLLIALQYGVTLGSVHSKAFARTVRSEPTLVLRGGEMLPKAMRQARITPAELRTVARTGGHAELDAIDAIVLESDGSFSVIAGAERAPDLPGTT
ncbi:membrane protein [Roseivivax halodurans JCM 10272]|uniref:Membrane protein n=1 Tax=Roseivivax halodurans JCM 10272 TaxID=1449350 RepID=X7EKC2_9RHOB|nr:YetF domain-containing protein [Roseivivax halodurans]ETX15603.1 membrane protein [Roseivivax halodurans JCM 10272]